MGSPGRVQGVPVSRCGPGVTNSRYRCQGCREYKPAPPWRKMGLGGVCSEACYKSRAVFSVRSAESPNGGAYIKGAAADGARIARAARALTIPTTVRTQVMFRDRNRCRWCGGIANHLHHIRYRSEGVDHSVHNLISLCRTHHDLVHTDKRRWQPVLLATVWLTMVEGRRFTIPQVERLLRK